jgi:hypothetical protein
LSDVARPEDQQIKFGLDDLKCQGNRTSLLVDTIDQVGDAAPGC